MIITDWNRGRNPHTYIHTYIHIYCHPQTDCFVLSELSSVARHAGHIPTTTLGQDMTQDQLLSGV